MVDRTVEPLIVTAVGQETESTYHDPFALILASYFNAMFDLYMMLFESFLTVL